MHYSHPNKLAFPRMTNDEDVETGLERCKINPVNRKRFYIIHFLLSMGTGSITGVSSVLLLHFWLPKLPKSEFCIGFIALLYAPPTNTNATGTQTLAASAIRWRLYSFFQTAGCWFCLCTATAPHQTIFTLPLVRRNTISNDKMVVIVKMVASAAAVPSLIRVTS